MGVYDEGSVHAQNPDRTDIPPSPGDSPKATYGTPTDEDWQTIRDHGKITHIMHVQKHAVLRKRKITVFVI